MDIVKKIRFELKLKSIKTSFKHEFFYVCFLKEQTMRC